MQEREDRTLPWTEFHFPRIPFRTKLQWIHDQVVHPEAAGRLGAGLRATQDTANARQEFVFSKWLANEIIRPELQAHHNIDLLALRRKKQHWNIRISGTYPAANLI